MTQAERDRLVTLRKASKGLITQRQAGLELDVSARQVRRLVTALRKHGDRAVVHGSKQKPSPRKIPEQVRQKALEILGSDVYRGFGPTLAAEYLAARHAIPASRETVRQWMVGAGLWRRHKQTVGSVHRWRARRSLSGELVQWDTSEHDWLEGRGQRMYLIAMIDDATSRMYARFVTSDSTEENLRTLEGYVRAYGRPLAFYTDKASLFQVSEKRFRDEPGVDKDPVERPPTQIGRALRELDIVWIGAHSPQAKGRVERGFSTAQDRLVKGMRVAGIQSLEEANRYLEAEFLPWWNRTLTVLPASEGDAHRSAEKYDLASILSVISARQVRSDYTLQFEARTFGIQRASIRPRLRGAKVRVEKRLDGTVAVRYGEGYLAIAEIEQPAKAEPRPKPATVQPPRGSNAGAKSQWMKSFSVRGGPSLEKAIAIANATAG